MPAEGAKPQMDSQIFRAFLLLTPKIFDFYFPHLVYKDIFEGKITILYFLSLAGEAGKPF